MPRETRSRKPPAINPWISRIAAAALVLAVVVFAGIRWLYGPRLWWRVPAFVTVNGRLAREASVYRSGEGTLLVDLRHAPTRADNEGGGYLVQPYWNRVRAIAKGYYELHGPFVLVDEMWMPSSELSLENPLLKIDPMIEAEAHFVSFQGLDHDAIVVHGDVLLPWPGR